MAAQLDHPVPIAALLKGAVGGAMAAFGFLALAGLSAAAAAFDAIIPPPPLVFAMVTTALLGVGLLATSRGLRR